MLVTAAGDPLNILVAQLALLATASLAQRRTSHRKDSWVPGLPWHPRTSAAYPPSASDPGSRCRSSARLRGTVGIAHRHSRGSWSPGSSSHPLPRRIGGFQPRTSLRKELWAGPCMCRSAMLRIPAPAGSSRSRCGWHLRDTADTGRHHSHGRGCPCRMLQDDTQADTVFTSSRQS